MIIFTIRRLFQAVPMLIGSSFLSFWLATVSGDPVLNKFVTRNPPPPANTIRLEHHLLRMDRPFLVQYWEWIAGLITKGDWGPSIDSLKIGSAVGSALIVTLRLVVGAIVVALILAVVAGVIAAYRQYSMVDYSLAFVGFVLLAVPGFWIAALIKHGAIWFNNSVQPILGYRPIPTTGEQATIPPTDVIGKLRDSAVHLLLPTLALAATTYSTWARYMRSSLLEVLSTDYIRLARAKGLTPARVTLYHALRTSLIPMTTITSMHISFLLGGSVIIEQVFGWRGMGNLFVHAVDDRDRYVIMATVTVGGMIVIAGNIVADILYAVLDPRTREGLSAERCFRPDTPA